MQDLLSKIEMRPVDHFLQQYTMRVIKEDNDGEPFFNYGYTSDGYCPEDLAETTRNQLRQIPCNELLALCHRSRFHFPDLQYLLVKI